MTRLRNTLTLSATLLVLAFPFFPAHADESLPASASGPVLPNEAEILWSRAQEQQAAQKIEIGRAHV